jgi:catalase
VTSGDILQRAGEKMPVLVRFSTVGGQQGILRPGARRAWLAAKFYTKEGNWDIVGSNIPVFFIQDANPGRNQIPRPHPRGQAGARSRHFRKRKLPTTICGISCR